MPSYYCPNLAPNGEIYAMQVAYVDAEGKIQKTQAAERHKYDGEVFDDPYEAVAFGVANIMAAKRPARVRERACCPRAVLASGCVCSELHVCKEHGEKHHGTHD